MSIDLNHVHPKHDSIDRRLCEWSRWVKVRPVSWATAPMFRMYKAPKQFESDLYVPIAINTLDASEMERAVSFLPDKHRTAIRWCYVHSHVPVGKVQRELGATREALAGLIHDGRSMLVNRLRERLIEK